MGYHELLVHAAAGHFGAGLSEPGVPPDSTVHLTLYARGGGEHNINTGPHPEFSDLPTAL